MKAYHNKLFRLISLLKNEQEAGWLLKDLLTPQELDSIAERWMIVNALNEGLTQRDVAKKLGVSISTVTRGARTLKYGTGAFRKFLQSKK